MTENTKAPIKILSAEEYAEEQRNPNVRYVIGRRVVERKLDINQHTLDRLVADGVLPPPFTIPGSQKHLWFERTIDDVIDSWAAAAKGEEAAA